MKAEELIKNNSLSTKDLPYVVNQDGKDQEVVFKDVALTAVNMARKEEQERAFKVLEFMLDEWMGSGDAELFLGNFKAELKENK